MLEQLKWKRLPIPNVGQSLEQLKPQKLLTVMYNGKNKTKLWRMFYSFLKSSSDMTNKNAYPQKSCSWMFIAALLIIGNSYNIILIIDNTCKQHQCSMTGKWISKLW